MKEGDIQEIRHDEIVRQLVKDFDVVGGSVLQLNEDTDDNDVDDIGVVDWVLCINATVVNGDAVTLMFTDAEAKMLLVGLIKYAGMRERAEREKE